MINNVILVGTVIADPVMHKISEDFYACNLALRVTKGYRDVETGEYSNDIISVNTWNGIAKLANNYVKKGDVIGVKGRLATKVLENDGDKKYELRVIGERIIFINVSRMDQSEFAKAKNIENAKKRNQKSKTKNAVNKNIDSDDFLDEEMDDIIDNIQDDFCEPELGIFNDEEND